MSHRFLLGAQGNEVYGGDKVGIFLHLSSDDASVKGEITPVGFHLSLITWEK